MSPSPKKRARREASGLEVAPRRDELPPIPSMREVAGPFDPFAEKRKEYTESSDIFMQVCGWIARAWREDDAIEITGIERPIWGKWKIEHPEEFRTAKALGQAMIFAEIRGVALGITTRRGQAASQKLLTEILGVRDKPKQSKAESVQGDMDPGRIEAAMGEFETEQLEEMANFDDDGDTA